MINLNIPSSTFVCSYLLRLLTPSCTDSIPLQAWRCYVDIPFISFQGERRGYKRQLDENNPDVATSAHVATNSFPEIIVELIRGISEETCCRRRRHQSHPLASKEERDTNEYRISVKLEKQQLNFFLSRQGKYLRRRTLNILLFQAF